ncbi:helix-turn-helix domain-containing protein [Kitasatospora sp. NPDC092948]|uniref:helix-turn-helix domain-containing protein n=1 Tax=Kitasatospora sp. NPDC092948 TaxID=3364088 RepID=UPI003802814C
MDRDWKRFGVMVEAGRRRLGWTQDDLAREADISPSTVFTMERGIRTKPAILSTHRVVARALGWMDGSVEKVLAGGSPELTTHRADSEASRSAGSVEASVEAGVDTLLDDLTVRVRGALLGGQVVDATAVPMGEGDVILIWKAGEKQKLTAAQQRKLEQQWHRFQRAAHDILADDEEQQDQ